MRSRSSWSRRGSIPSLGATFPFKQRQCDKHLKNTFERRFAVTMLCLTGQWSAHFEAVDRKPEPYGRLWIRDWMASPYCRPVAKRAPLRSSIS
jgi:hypothetical protein